MRVYIMYVRMYIYIYICIYTRIYSASIYYILVRVRYILIAKSVSAVNVMPGRSIGIKNAILFARFRSNCLTLAIIITSAAACTYNIDFLSSVGGNFIPHSTVKSIPIIIYSIGAKTQKYQIILYLTFYASLTR